MRHSYRVLLKEAKANRLSLLVTLTKNEKNERAKKRLSQIEKQIEWIEGKINDGKDTGCYTL